MPAFVGDAAGETRGTSMEISGTAEKSGTILPFPNVLHIPVRFGTRAQFLPSAGTYYGYHRSRTVPDRHRAAACAPAQHFCTL